MSSSSQTNWNLIYRPLTSFTLVPPARRSAISGSGEKLQAVVFATNHHLFLHQPFHNYYQQRPVINLSPSPCGKMAGPGKLTRLRTSSLEWFRITQFDFNGPKWNETLGSRMKKNVCFFISHWWDYIWNMYKRSVQLTNKYIKAIKNVHVTCRI